MTTPSARASLPAHRFARVQEEFVRCRNVFTLHAQSLARAFAVDRVAEYLIIGPLCPILDGPRGAMALLV